MIRGCRNNRHSGGKEVAVVLTQAYSDRLSASRCTFQTFPPKCLSTGSSYESGPVEVEWLGEKWSCGDVEDVWQPFIEAHCSRSDLKDVSQTFTTSFICCSNLVTRSRVSFSRSEMAFACFFDICVLRPRMMTELKGGQTIEFLVV
jgi:hypothetical protein